MSLVMAHAMVSVATGVLAPVIVKLSTLLEKQYHSLKSVRGDIAFLKDELSSMNALLLKLADMDNDDLDIQVKEWRDQIRELSYDTEDCIDYFMHRVGDGSNSEEEAMGFLQKNFQKLKNFLRCKKMAGQILKLKARADNASERRRRYAINGSITCSSGNVPIDPRLPALYAEAKNLVGIDGPRDELINWLTIDDGMPEQKLKVVSVVGLAGLGKTTLVRQVLHKIGDQFDYVAFVSVSQKPDMSKILKNLLIKITKKDYVGIEGWDDERLINTLREMFKDKRYFIIIDDIWSTSPWETIRCAFPENGSGSRILTTTRIITVAETCSWPDNENVYKMKPLSDKDAEKLFIKRIFGSEDQCPSQLKEVSSDILKKCGGLPLAIITVASLLASNKPCTKERWETYRDYVGPATEPFHNMKRILSLSYNDLPHHLKTCLLYLSTFPEDFLIWRDTLVRRWIAEGLIVNTEGGLSLKEVGENNFNELINRSMIQPMEIHYDGQAYACQVHDLILDFIVSKSVKENFVTVSQNHILKLQEKTRRLSLDFRSHSIMVPSSMDFSCVRSLITYGSTDNMPVLSDFLVLRAIAIEGNARLENRHLSDIGRLFQLKYLRLSEVNVSELPKQICKLQQLEALELRRTRIRELPKNIVELKRLVTLVADNTILPEGIGNMKALQRLSGMIIDTSIPYDTLCKLGGLTELKTLWIIWSVSDTHCDQNIYTVSFVSCINELCRSKLRYLQIGSTDGSSLDLLLGSWPHPPHPLYNFQMTTYYCFPRVPEWMASLSDVTFLDINLVSIGEEFLGILGGLPCLLSLSVTTQVIIPAGRLIFRGSGFECLKEFYFHSWHELVGPLLFEPGAMPKLEKFRFNLWASKAASLSTDYYIGLQNMVRLKHLLVEVDCRDARAEEVEATEASVRNAIAVNSLPSHVQIEIKRNWVNRMVEVGSNSNVNQIEETVEKIHYN